MKRIFFIAISILTISNLCNSQSKLGNESITGSGGIRIKFDNGNIISNNSIYYNSYFYHGNSCICDTSGNLILASDGYNVYNNIGNYIDGGDTLVPNDFYINQNGWSVLSQSSIFLPMDSEKYYFITPAMSDVRFADCQANNNCHFDLLLYNVIDMNANAGAGKVVRRMQPLMENARLRKTQMMACRHGNGKNWWLLKHEGDSANVHVFLFTQDSVYDKGVQMFNGPIWGVWDTRGQSTFNSDGSQYATTSHGDGSGLIMLADFDRCYGILSNSRVIQMPIGSQHFPSDTTIMESLSVGLCYSPNNKYLYVISMSNIYQYDLQDSTWFHVAGLDTSILQFQNYETAYLGQDSKIYIGNASGISKQMSVIDNPDIKGAGCNFCPRCLRLDSLGANAYVGTPPCMPNYGLGARECWPLQNENLKEKEKEWLVYPNPAYQNIYIKNARGKKKTLYNLSGQVISSTTKDEIDVSKYAKGLYFIQIENAVRKVIIE